MRLFAQIHFESNALLAGCLLLRRAPLMTLLMLDSIGILRGGTLTLLEENPLRPTHVFVLQLLQL